MRTVAGDDDAQPTGTLADFTDKVTIEVADADDVLVDLTEFAVSLEYDESVDAIVAGATVVFRRLSGVDSLAPLMTASPPVALGRRIVVSIDPGSGTLREVFRGKIDDVDWPERFGDVTVVCRDQAGVIADTWIEEGREYGDTDGNVSLESVMQAVADDNLASPPTLYFPVATSAVVQHVEGDPPYGPTEQSTLDAERALAESIGWTIRYRNFDATANDWKWTVFEPSRTKTVPDHTFGVDDYWDVTTMQQSVVDIRNVVEVAFVGEGEVLDSVTVTDATSIAAYGRRYMKITEGSGSPVNTVALATALANAALSDLKDPDALLEIQCRYFWPGEIGVDLYRFTANETHFTDDQDLAVMAFRHRIAVGERPTTWILTRGKPSGGVLMWQRRRPTSLVSEFRVSNFREVARSETEVTFGWDLSGDVRELWVYTSTPTQPIATDPWAALTGVPTARLTGDTDEYTVTIPDAGQVTYGRLIPIGPHARIGNAWDFTAQGEGLDAIPQGVIAIPSGGTTVTPTAVLDGAPWVASYKWAESTSAFPSDATARAGTTANGRQVTIALSSALALGDSVYLTALPYVSTNAGGLEGSSVRIKATRHDFSATKTVYVTFNSFLAFPVSTYLATTGYLSNVGMPALYFESVYGDLLVPSGVTLTGISADLYLVVATSEQVTVSLERVGTDGTTTNIANVQAAGGGWTNETDTCSESTTGRRYRVFLQLGSATGGSPPADGAMRASVFSYTYSMPDSAKAI